MNSMFCSLSSMFTCLILNRIPACSSSMIKHDQIIYFLLHEISSRLGCSQVAFDLDTYEEEFNLKEAEIEQPFSENRFKMQTIGS